MKSDERKYYIHPNTYPFIYSETHTHIFIFMNICTHTHKIYVYVNKPIFRQGKKSTSLPHCCAQSVLYTVIETPFSVSSFPGHCRECCWYPAPISLLISLKLFYSLWLLSLCMWVFSLPWAHLVHTNWNRHRNVRELMLHKKPLVNERQELLFNTSVSFSLSGTILFCSIYSLWGFPNAHPHVDSG